MLGIEALNGQGIHFQNRQSDLDGFHNSLLLDLAGNAFHTGSCMVSMFSVLCCLAKGQALYFNSLVVQRPLESLTASASADGYEGNGQGDGRDSEDLLSDLFPP